MYLERVMKKVIGFAMFCVALGMVLMMILSNIFVGVLIVLVLLLLGYNFFCCWIKKEDVSICFTSSLFFSNFKSYARSTLPDFKQEVHTYVFLAPPFSVLIFTDFTFDFHIFGDFLFEWLTLFPKWAPLPQIAHLAMIAPPNDILKLYQTHNICYSIR